MSWIDFLLVLILLLIVVLVVYFSFVKDNGNPCKGCPYSKGCNKGDCRK